LHYEVFGRRGEPIIFLHSWVGSWRYWVSTMDLMAERYRTYALDFWGFGDSEHQGASFTIDDYVHCLIAFMEKMGIAQANLVGHGLGGMVAIRAAQEHPEHFLRLVVVSTPIHGQVLSEVSKPGKFARFLGRNTLASVWAKLIRQVPVDDPEVQKDLYEDTDSLSEDVMQRIYESMIETDLQPSLRAIQNIPVLIIYGEKDTIVPPDHAQFLNGDAARFQQLIVLPQVNHFPFLEQTSTFSRLLIDFMKSEPGQHVEVKEHWRRRVSQREYL
jgi:pimeloyl-ACP methyl ester carboxylesterase